MKVRSLVWRELFERKNQLATSFLAIVFGITAIVAIRNTTFYSEKAVAREMDALGANVLVLPKSVTLQDYYSADLHDDVFPEEYVTRLALSDVQGVDNLSPKLSVPVRIGERAFTLTGILPKNEFQAKAAWRGAGVFARPEGCGEVGVAAAPAEETLVRRRVIETLGDSEILLGAEVAEATRLDHGATLDLLGRTFQVLAVLPRTGTVDDSRVFAHLHVVQDLSGKGTVVNAIEIVGCCQAISEGLVQKVNRLLPEAKVVTVTQVVDTQLRMNRLMSNLSLVFLAIIAVVGGATIANYMYANVFERRREIGTLMAMGAARGVITRMFLLKALVLGAAGGICGYVAGTVLAVTLGPRLAGVAVLPMPGLILWAIAVPVVVSLAASWFPARRASRLDPCAALQET